jgi:hypothetical protein
MTGRPACLRRDDRRAPQRASVRSLQRPPTYDVCFKTEAEVEQIR